MKSNTHHDCLHHTKIDEVFIIDQEHLSLRSKFHSKFGNRSLLKNLESELNIGLRDLFSWWLDKTNLRVLTYRHSTLEEMLVFNMDFELHPKRIGEGMDVCYSIYRQIDDDYQMYKERFYCEGELITRLGQRHAVSCLKTSEAGEFHLAVTEYYAGELGPFENTYDLKPNIWLEYQCVRKICTLFKEGKINALPNYE